MFPKKNITKPMLPWEKDHAENKEENIAYFEEYLAKILDKRPKIKFETGILVREEAGGPRTRRGSCLTKNNA